MLGEDIDRATGVKLTDRAVFMEFVDDGVPAIDKLKDLAPPRVAKTHLPYRFVNRWVERDGVKTIVTLRNPKDTLVSCYHFYLNNPGDHYRVI